MLHLSSSGAMFSLEPLLSWEPLWVASELLALIQQKKIIKRSDRDLKNCFRSYFLVNLTFLNVFFPSDEYPNESFKF